MHSIRNYISYIIRKNIYKRMRCFGLIGKKITIINARFVKPLDTKLLDTLSKVHQMIFTFEEGAEIGGFGSAVLSYYSKKNSSPKVYIKGIDDSFVEHGSRKELLKITGLDRESILSFIIDRVKNEK